MSSTINYEQWHDPNHILMSDDVFIILCRNHNGSEDTHYVALRLFATKSNTFSCFLVFQICTDGQIYTDIKIHDDKPLVSIMESSLDLALGWFCQCSELRLYYFKQHSCWEDSLSIEIIWRCKWLVHNKQKCGLWFFQELWFIAEFQSVWHACFLIEKFFPLCAFLSVRKQT